MKPTRRPRFVPCAHCGADVAIDARSCRECGSDAATGWSDDAELDYGGLDLPQGYRRDADYQSTALPPRKTPRWIAVTALVMVVVFVLAFVLRVF